MIIRVDASQALPVYEQIREQVTRMVVGGTLAEGTRVPTIRQLANDLGVAKGTVAKAYALLEAASVVESRGHKGTFILAPSNAPAGDLSALTDAASSYVVAARQLGVSREQAIDELNKTWIDGAPSSPE